MFEYPNSKYNICSCGCGEEIPHVVNTRGKLQRYKKNHHQRTLKYFARVNHTKKPCVCGCGELIDIFDKKGRPRRYKNYHRKGIGLGRHLSLEAKTKIGLGNLGKKVSEETRKRISKSSKSGENHPMWKGDDVGIIKLHVWIRRHLSKPEFCQICRSKPPYDLANINPKYNPETYNRDFKNWQWLCRKCHMISDGRMNNLKQFGT